MVHWLIWLIGSCREDLRFTPCSILRLLPNSLIFIMYLHQVSPAPHDYNQEDPALQYGVSNPHWYSNEIQVTNNCSLPQTLTIKTQFHLTSKLKASFIIIIIILMQ